MTRDHLAGCEDPSCHVDHSFLVSRFLQLLKLV
jgi:hypothetical protein